MRTRFLKHIAPFVAAGLVTACAPTKAVVTPNPTDVQVQETRRLADQALSAIDTGITIAEQVSLIVDKLPLTPERKNDIDCQVYRAIGPSGRATPEVAAAVRKACGEVAGVLRAALVEIPKLAARPSLLATIRRAVEVVDPLVVKLEQSGNDGLRALAIVLRTAFIFARGLEPPESLTGLSSPGLEVRR
jgi:uncharacterized membrane protein